MTGTDTPHPPEPDRLMPSWLTLERVLVAGSLIFSIGVNWQRMNNLESRISSIEAQPVDYVRKETADERYQRLTGQLTEVQAQIAELRRILIQQR